MEKNYHYVYQIINKQTKRFYIGVRSSILSPKKDLGIKYFSSSRDKDFIATQRMSPVSFWYHIKRVFSSRKAAINYEGFLQTKLDVVNNKQSYNRSIQKTDKFDITGYRHTSTTKKKISAASIYWNKVINDDPIKRKLKSARISASQQSILRDPVRAKEVSRHKKEGWVKLKKNGEKFKARNEKISRSLKNRFMGGAHPQSKSIIQLDGNKIIKIWGSIAEAKRKITGDIMAVLVGRQLTAAGFNWKYINKIKGPEWK